MTPKLYKSFALSILHGEVNASELDCQMYLGWKSGKVIPDTVQEIGEMEVWVEGDDIKFDWAPVVYKWVAEKSCDAIVIKSGEMLIAYFDKYGLCGGDTIEFRFYGSKPPVEPPTERVYTSWERFLIWLGSK